MLEVRDLSKSYGEVEAVRGVSFDSARGRGGGDHRPLRMRKVDHPSLSQPPREPTAGSLRLDDRELDFAERRTLPAGRDLARFRARFGMVFQQFDLFAHKTAIENVMVGQVVVKRTPPDQARNAARDLLRRVGLDGMEDRRPRELSGGQQQRVAIARALAMARRCCSSTR